MSLARWTVKPALWCNDKQNRIVAMDGNDPELPEIRTEGAETESRDNPVLPRTRISARHQGRKRELLRKRQRQHSKALPGLYDASEFRSSLAPVALSIRLAPDARPVL